MSSLFQNKIEPRCAYCANGSPMGGDEIACPRKGVVNAGSHCRKFTYDPLRRVPPRQQTEPPAGLKDEDFSL